MKRADVLQTAEKCVCGQRQQDYGTPENNFQAIADLWNVYISHAKPMPSDAPFWQFDAFDVAMLMALLKVGRIATGTVTDDSLVDACGYLACGAEIIDGEKAKDRSEFYKAEAKLMAGGTD